jgi:hypothetical protein
MRHDQRATFVLNATNLASRFQRDTHIIPATRLRLRACWLLLVNCTLQIGFIVGLEALVRTGH